MRVFDFNRAIVREPGASVVSGLRADATATPDFTGVKAEHAAYVAALRVAGLAVEMLPPLEAFPDSVFVEDPAFVVPEGAILLRPGAPSRRGETEELRGTLERHFGQVHALGGDEYVDGGDVLITPKAIFIGLSARTNRAGAEALARALATFDREARIVEAPKGVLHLKTVASLMDENKILATPAMAASDDFNGFEVITTPNGEEAAANALRVNDIVLVGVQYPRTAELLSKVGLSVQTLSVREVAKLDAGLSCMSLRWRTAF